MEKKDSPAEKKIDIAAALRYSSENDAPVVVAAGKGDLAAKIIEIAEREKVPLYRDSVLAQALVKLGAGVEIPPDLYSAVAHILVHVARLDRKLSASHGMQQP
ncbi:MAG: EscU/YscU/HrcU family type III secretion system export apparatus switch protein [Firmicutes bacterium]|nr:EscU/YscU/HrcU family type III secretion system export apparatus switch protein [Bacillota bacterium]MCL5056781.1 EscU/YscU/HrcU family type III secretion system export apparatus switch protein [Actinomycetota bacterium]